MAKNDQRPAAAQFKDEPDHVKDKIAALRASLADDAVNDHAALLIVTEILEDMLGIERPEPEETQDTQPEAVQAGG